MPQAIQSFRSSTRTETQASHSHTQCRASRDLQTHVPGASPFSEVAPHPEIQQGCLGSSIMPGFGRHTGFTLSVSRRKRT